MAKNISDMVRHENGIKDAMCMIDFTQGSFERGHCYLPPILSSYMDGISPDG